MWRNQAKWVWSQSSSILVFLIDCIHHLQSYPLQQTPLNWSNGFKDNGSWRVAETIGNKEMRCLVWLYLKISIFWVPIHFASSRHIYYSLSWWFMFSDNTSAFHLTFSKSGFIHCPSEMKLHRRVAGNSAIIAPGT